MDLSKLNPAQLEAVTAGQEPVLVIAGAGSGKTRVLSYRIAHLLDQNLFNPQEILGLTFTNKAAKEMLNRVEALTNKLNRMVHKPLLGTFHSFGVRVLRRESGLLGYKPNFVIWDTDDQIRAIKQSMERAGVGGESKSWSPNFFRHMISRAKNNLQTPSDFDADLESRTKDLVRLVFTNYQNFLFQQNAVDFDDLLLLPVKLFQSSPNLLYKYQNLFKYILVDEYQDTNIAQFRLLKLLSPESQIFVVGDDAQSIYGFRGADIGNILSFERSFPNARIVKLEQNYRSTKHILSIASSIISLNPEQKPKELWTDNTHGGRVQVRELEDEYHEASFVAETIIKSVNGEDLYIEEEPVEARPFSILDQFLTKQRRMVGANHLGSTFLRLPSSATGLNEYAILYRTHAQSRSFEDIFLRSGIPYQIVGGLRYYERKEIKDCLAFLRLVMNPKDIISLRRVINEPPRGIGARALEEIEFGLSGTEESKLIGSEWITSLKLQKKAQESIMQFWNELVKWTKLDQEKHLSDLLRLILRRTRLVERLEDGTPQGSERAENVRELFNVLGIYNTEGWQEALPRFLEEVALSNDFDSSEDGSSNKVTLMTLHSAKGLEFDNVFFVGLEEGILPHSRALTEPKELSEEIRLAYVGVTRARKQLFLTYARTRTVFGNTQMASPSRILRYLPEDSVVYHTTLLDQVENDGLTYERLEF